MMELEQVEFELDEVIGNVVDLTGNRLKTPDVELLVSIDDDVPERLVGDPLRPAQILLNLGSNAAQLTDNGRVMLQLRGRSDGVSVRGSAVRVELEGRGRTKKKK